MRILVANIPLPTNRFLADLNDALSKHVEITHDADLFWNMQGDFDLVHLHFPEYLTFGHQDAYVKGLTDELIEATEERLRYWGQRARLIVTRHVLLPHDALKDPQWEKMYEAVYRHMHGVVHFAQASVDEFKQRYANTKFVCQDLKKVSGTLKAPESSRHIFRQSGTLEAEKGVRNLRVAGESHDSEKGVWNFGGTGEFQTPFSESQESSRHLLLQPSPLESGEKVAVRPDEGDGPEHAIVPHHNYTSLPNEVSRSEARRRLGIANNSRVMLVFGAIRNDEERDLILKTFQAIKQKRKVLLVSKWRETLAKVSWIRLKYWLRDLNRLYYRLHPSYKFNYSFVEEEDTQLYLNAADVLFIPRLKVLNSGNITLGMTFGKVVVGPDSWDVGELLRETGNPVFDPEHPETAAAAVDRAFQLVEEGKVGPANQKLALEQWGADQCAAKYVEFFERLGAGSGEQGAKSRSKE
ncbi:MAG TPA: hypothetical protein PLR25_02240 [Planctomycetaceae bacterium]|nr:hypothetical protein [Planctomycetaceae bacterium]